MKRKLLRQELFLVMKVAGFSAFSFPTVCPLKIDLAPRGKVVYQAPFFGGKLAVRFGETQTAINEILNGSIQLF